VVVAVALALDAALVDFSLSDFVEPESGALDLESCAARASGLEDSDLGVWDWAISGAT
jgi:hypothetical protein